MTGVPALASIKNRLCGSCSHFGGRHAGECCCCCWPCGSCTTHMRSSEDCTANCLCNHGRLLSGCFYKTFIYPGKVCWACTSFCSSLLLCIQTITCLDFQAVRYNLPFCVGHWACRCYKSGAVLLLNLISLLLYAILLKTKEKKKLTQIF